jgi:hypothetical protein
MNLHAELVALAKKFAVEADRLDASSRKLASRPYTFRRKRHEARQFRRFGLKLLRVADEIEKSDATDRDQNDSDDRVLQG